MGHIFVINFLIIFKTYFLNSVIFWLLKYHLIFLNTSEIMEDNKRNIYLEMTNQVGLSKGNNSLYVYIPVLEVSLLLQLTSKLVHITASVDV